MMKIVHLALFVASALLLVTFAFDGYKPKGSCALEGHRPGRCLAASQASLCTITFQPSPDCASDQRCCAVKIPVKKDDYDSKKKPYDAKKPYDTKKKPYDANKKPYDSKPKDANKKPYDVKKPYDAKKDAKKLADVKKPFDVEKPLDSKMKPADKKPVDVKKPVDMKKPVVDSKPKTGVKVAKETPKYGKYSPIASGDSQRNEMAVNRWNRPWKNSRAFRPRYDSYDNRRRGGYGYGRGYGRYGGYGRRFGGDGFEDTNSVMPRHERFNRDRFNGFDNFDDYSWPRRDDRRFGFDEYHY